MADSETVASWQLAVSVRSGGPVLSGPVRSLSHLRHRTLTQRHSFQRSTFHSASHHRLTLDIRLPHRNSSVYSTPAHRVEYC